MFKFNQRKRILLITKRHRFIIGVLVSSFLLFIAEYSLGKSGVALIFGISILTDIFLFWALRRDLKDYFSFQIFFLPFLYTLSFGLFYFLFPARLIVRIIMTLLFSVGLYSIYLSQNIFTVSSIRTIALLSSARTVSFLLTIVSFFFGMNVIFAMHLSAFITFPLIFLFSLPLVLHSIWTYTLERSIRHEISWGILLSFCISEVSFLLWFWPSTPTFIALFLTGIFYIIVGLSHVWFEKKLFRGVILEYVWVAIFVFIFLVAFTSWT